MSLEELIQACAENGDEAAWEEFIQRFHTMIKPRSCCARPDDGERVLRH